QQRGIITSGIQFFRTMGGAVGIGMMGMLFNVLVAPQMSRLHSANVNPVDLMDPHRRAAIPPELLHSASGMIASGLTWVFAAMLIFAVLQTLATLLLPSRRPRPHPSRSAGGAGGITGIGSRRKEATAKARRREERREATQKQRQEDC